MKMRFRLVVAGIVIAVGIADTFVACVSDGNTTTDATTDTTSPTEAGSDVVIGDGGCSSQTPDDTAGEFVSATGSDSSTCGTRQSPCKTIQQGITNATQTTGKTKVYVASGAYVESITLAANLTIEGGWTANASTWTPICDNTTSTAVTIQGVTNITVTATYSGSSTLNDVKILSKGNASPGESLYGVFATGSATSLTLGNVVITLDAGGAGNVGDAGTGGANAFGICNTGNGSVGAAGAGGQGALVGTFTPLGYVPTNGLGGSTGTAGGNGTVSSPGTCSTAANCATTCSIKACNFVTASMCAGDGGSGCGASPGSGGVGGAGGGSSVAVYVWDAHVVLIDGSYASGNGGNGGSGGEGADGGSGSIGVVGAGGECVTNWSCSGSSCSFIAGYALAGGAAGGTGGAGGPGGQGGGGSGGLSYAIVQGGDAGVTLNGTPTLAHGDGGTGGALSGASGTSADRWP